MKKRRRSCLPFLLIFFSLLAVLILAIGSLVPLVAQNSFGPPNPALSAWQRVSYGLELLAHSSEVILPLDPLGAEQLFIIESGDSVGDISQRLEQAGIIRNARTFRTYLVWTGMDAYILTGTFRLSPALSAESIAGMLQSSMLTEVYFTILAGWRMDEVAAALPTSGLAITTGDFLTYAASPNIFPELVPPGASAEGFLYPATYILPRSTTADQLVSVFLQRFLAEMPEEYPAAFEAQGLSIFQAVTLASIIEREAVVDEEMPMIASVFFNRLAIGMKLQTDPTVQYAIGYNQGQNTWWTTPLSAQDMQIDSLYNTYLYPGLPPGPISNPGAAALQAVAFPAQSPYYYFQAKCDNSGLHNFAETFEQHEQNYCP